MSVMCYLRKKRKKDERSLQIGQHPNSLSWPLCQPASSVLSLPTWTDAWVCLSNQKFVFVCYLSNVNSQQAKPARESSEATSDEPRCDSRHLPMGASKRVPRAPKKLSWILPAAVTLGTLPAASRSRCPGAFPSNTRAFGDGGWSVGDVGRVCFPAAAPAECLRLVRCVRGWECACREGQ